MVKRRPSLRAALVCVIGILLLVAPASAQTVLGRVAGTVLDASGGVLPGATVTLTNVATTQAATAVTTDTGAFTFPQVPAGTYKVVVELQGFKTATYTQVIVNVGPEYSLTAKLEIGAVERDRRGRRRACSLVKTTTPEVSTTVQQREVLALPLPGRDVTNLIRLQAGVPGITQRSSTAINGGRPTWTQVTHGRHQRPGQLHPDQLPRLPAEPADVGQRGRDSASRRRCPGADSAGGATSVRMVTPSGTNAFRGSVFESNRNSDLSANSFFNNKSGVAKPFLNRNQFGAPARRADPEEQAVLLRVLRGVPPGQHDGAEQHHPGPRRLGPGRLPLRGARRHGAVPQRPAAGGRAARREDPVDRAGEHAEGVIGQQLRHRRLAVGSDPEHGRVPLQPEGPEQPRPVRVPVRLRAEREATASRRSSATSRKPTTGPTSTW